jgi:hypothetical protein
MEEGRGRRQGRGERGGRGGNHRWDVCPRPDEPLTAFLARELAEAQFVPHGMQTRLVHVEEIAQGAVGDPLLALEHPCHRPQHRVEEALTLSLRARVERRCGRCARPDEDVAPLIERHALALDEFVLDIFEGRLVELKLPFEGAVGQTPALAEQGHHLIHHRHKVHRVSSLPGARSP